MQRTVIRLRAEREGAWVKKMLETYAEKLSWNHEAGLFCFLADSAETGEGGVREPIAITAQGTIILHGLAKGDMSLRPGSCFLKFLDYNPRLRERGQTVQVQIYSI